MEDEEIDAKDGGESSSNVNDKEQHTLDLFIEEGYEPPVSSGNVVELASIRNRRLRIDVQLIKNKDN